MSYLPILRRYALMISLSTVLTAGGAAALAYSMTPKYEAIATALIPPKSGGGLSSALSSLAQGGDLGSLGGLAGLATGSSTASVSDLLSILRSRGVSDRVSQKLKLDQIEEFIDPAQPTREGHLKLVMMRLKVSQPTAKDGTLSIRFKSEDPELSAKIVNAYVAELSAYLEKTNFNKAKQNRVFIEQQLEKKKIELSQSENAMLHFQQVNKSVSLTEEVRLMIKSIADLESQHLAADVALKEAQSRVKSAEQKVAGLSMNWSDTLAELEIEKQAVTVRKSALERARHDYQDMMKNLPDKGILLARLERDLKLQNALYLLLSEQLQVAKLEEAREVEAFRVLDPAIATEKPVEPRKKLMIALGAALGLLFGSLLALFLHHWRAIAYAPLELSQDAIPTSDPERLAANLGPKGLPE